MEHKILLLFFSILAYVTIQQGLSFQCYSCSSLKGWKDCYAKQKVENCSNFYVCMKARRTVHYKDGKIERNHYIGCFYEWFCTRKACRRYAHQNQKAAAINITCDEIECRTGNKTWLPTTSPVKRVTADQNIRLSVAGTVATSSTTRMRPSTRDNQSYQCYSCSSLNGWKDCYAKPKVEYCSKLEACMKVRRSVQYKNGEIKRTHYIGCVYQEFCTRTHCRRYADRNEKDAAINITCDQFECGTGNKTWPPITSPVKKATAGQNDRPSEAAVMSSTTKIQWLLEVPCSVVFLVVIAVVL